MTNKIKVLIVPIIIILFTSCGVIRPKPNIREEVIVHYVDSISWHDSTVITYLTKERYVDLVKPLDTLNLETSYAKASAYLDTSFRALKGFIENKSDVPVKTIIKWKEKIVYKDSIQTKEIPVEVIVSKEVVKYPKTYWWFMVFTILSCLYIIIKVYLKFKL